MSEKEDTESHSNQIENIVSSLLDENSNYYKIRQSYLNNNSFTSNLQNSTKNENSIQNALEANKLTILLNISEFCLIGSWVYPSTSSIRDERYQNLFLINTEDTPKNIIEVFQLNSTENNPLIVQGMINLLNKKFCLKVIYKAKNYELNFDGDIDFSESFGSGVVSSITKKLQYLKLVYKGEWEFKFTKNRKIKAEEIKWFREKFHINVIPNMVGNFINGNFEFGIFSKGTPQKIPNIKLTITTPLYNHTKKVDPDSDSNKKSSKTLTPPSKKGFPSENSESAKIFIENDELPSDSNKKNLTKESSKNMNETLEYITEQETIEFLYNSHEKECKLDTQTFNR